MANDPALESTEALHAEIERLRQRVAELERAQAAPAAGVPYAQIFEALPLSLHVRRADGLAVTANRLHRLAVGMESADKSGVRHNILEDPQAIAGGFVESFQRAAQGEVVRMPPAFYDLSKSDLPGAKAAQFWLESTFFSVDDEAGQRYVVEMHRDVSAEQQREEMFRSIFDNSPMFMYAKDLQGRYILVNRETAAACKLTVPEMLGKTDYDLLAREVADSLVEADRQVSTTGEMKHIEEHVITPRGLILTSAVKFPLRDAQRTIYGVCGIGIDITAQKQAEEENRRLQDEMMRMREAALRALSTPLIPIAKGVLVMPLIGDVDQERSRQVLETLLHGVSHSRARIAILDVTGVTSAGPEVADGLIQAARAVRLLGAQVVLTGVQPQMAQTLATMSDGLGDIITRGTLESGVDYAMRALRG